jgi:hypothetical protein
MIVIERETETGRRRRRRIKGNAKKKEEKGILGFMFVLSDVKCALTV